MSAGIGPATGAGRAAKEANLYAEVGEGVHAYAIAGHRHAPEIEQSLGEAAGRPVTVNFTPHLMPMNRGVLATIYVRFADGADIWVEGPEGGRVLVKAMVTPRVGRGVVFMPFHFGGMWMGEDQRHKYPAGSDPYVIGEAANTAQTYGYDSVTMMQETKSTLCRIYAA